MHSTEAEIVQQDNQKYLISGAVDFSTTPDLVRQFVKLVRAAKRNKAKEKTAAKNLIIDMSQVTDCNSAGLAFMLEITKDIQLSNVSVQFENLPDTLLTIAKAYGIENEILGMCNRNV